MQQTIPSAVNQWTINPQPPPQAALEQAQRILNSVLYCSLATSSTEGHPWCSPVFFAFDAELNLYWSSAVVSQHSQNIYNNGGQVSISVYESNCPEGTTGQGFYLLGKASEMDLQGIQYAFPLMEKRSGKPIPRSYEDYLGQSPRRMYRFTPSTVWCNGERFPQGNQLLDTKIEVSLAALQAFMEDGSKNR